jgi:hypothetical protein
VEIFNPENIKPVSPDPFGQAGREVYMYKKFLSITWTGANKKIFAGWRVTQSECEFEPLTHFPVGFFFDTVQAVMVKALGSEWFREVSLGDSRKSLVRERRGSSGCVTMFVYRCENPEFDWYIVSSRVHVTCSRYLTLFKFTYCDLYRLLREFSLLYEDKAVRVVVREVEKSDKDKEAITADDLGTAVKAILAGRVIVNPSESPTPEG